ncbi:unnamed protein product [Oikopleura dioica]|uniref:Uncharacterized protein n=1 Tax=Oikopleura dioica TaxID=34765 RepID=E4Y0L3_OIKDI|nr:unnamed protein product [Oikopleura dioica]
MTPAFLSRFRAQPGSIKNSFEEFAPILEVSARVMKKSCTQVECVSMLETVQHEKGMSGARLLLRAVITKRNKPRNFNSFRRRILECRKLTDISHKNSNRGRFLIIFFAMSSDVLIGVMQIETDSVRVCLASTLLQAFSQANNFDVKSSRNHCAQTIRTLFILTPAFTSSVNPFAPDNTLSSTVERLLFNFSIWQNNPKPVGYQNVSRSRWILNKPPNKVHFFKDASSLISLERNYSPKKMTSIENR